MAESLANGDVAFRARQLEIQIQTPPRLTDNVYHGLRQAIIQGRLAAGSKLSVPALAQQLNVSRSPVREAVARLITDRLAVESPRKGAVVAKVTIPDLLEMYEAREPLEGMAARLAASYVDDELRHRLRAIMNEHRTAVQAGDDARGALYDLRFHSAISVASRNPTVDAWLSQLQSRVQIAMLTTSVTAGVQAALDDHERICAAITLGDEDGAEKAARSHIARLRNVLSKAAPQVPPVPGSNRT